MSGRTRLSLVLLAPLCVAAACGGAPSPLADRSGTPGTSTKPNTTQPPGGTNDSSSPENTHSSGGSSWTVLVYMVADNDLEPFALYDLEEMMNVGSTGDFQIVVEADRAVGYTSQSIGGIPDWTTAKRLYVEGGSLRELSDLGELNMGDPQNLANFISWGIENYPADNIALVLWDHGQAWPGFAADMSHNYDALTIAELKSGIADGLSRARRERFTVIGFDACLMGSLETALALRDSGEYLLASEELEPGHGWDYSVLSAVRDDPTLDAISLGDTIIRGFRAQALAQGTSATITLSLVDLYALKAIERALEAVQDLYRTSLATAFGRARTQALEFGKNPTLQKSPQMVDLGDVMLGIADSASSEVPRKVTEAIHHAVMTQTRGSAMTAATGIAIYWPSASLYDAEYETVPDIDAWRDILGMLLDVDERNASVAPTFVSSTASATNQGNYVRISGQLATGTEVNVTQEGIYYGMVENGEAYVLGDSFGQLTSSGLVIADWDRTVMTVAQGGQKDWAYYSFQKGENGSTVASVPFGYATQAGGALQMALLVAIYSSSGTLQQQTLYLTTAAGYGQLTPASGSKLYPIYGHITTNGIEWLATSTALNAQQPLNFAFEPLSTAPANRNAYALLYAQDYAGNATNATWAGKF